LTFPYTGEQLGRLRDLGAAEGELGATFPGFPERDKAFLVLRKKLAASVRREIGLCFQNGARPPVETISETLCRSLSGLGFVQVSTPVIMSRARLVKMGLEGDPLLADQVFWLDEKRCLRPMLAPHLYEYMLDVQRLRPGKVFGLFEVGPCFRKESQGSRHSGEFTMLNLVEVGLPEETREARLEALAARLLGDVSLGGWSLETTDSSVYGRTVDIVDKNGLELASCSMGPHPLDKAWGFEGTWLGIGLGLERLAMSLAGLDRLSPVARGFGRVAGRTLSL
jgi:phenylalanyl-tRNA synthetase alpha chain